VFATEKLENVSEKKNGMVIKKFVIMKKHKLYSCDFAISLYIILG
jgi:hypothetical protein